MSGKTCVYLGVLLGTSSFLTCCGGSNGGSSGSGGGGSPPISVMVTVAATTVDGSDSTALTASVANDKNAAGVTWTLSGGGTLSNTTTASATYTAPSPSGSALTVSVTATSITDPTKSNSATITVPAQPEITTGVTSAIVGAVGSSFSAQLQGSGGIPPYKWAAVGGNLPSCLTLSAAGILTTASGTPPTKACEGSYNPIVTMTDSGTPNPLTTPQTTLTVTINAAPSIQFTGSVPTNAVMNEPYTGGSAAATGGAGSLSYSVSAGALPTGLQLNSTTAAITGTPTAAGTFNFTIMAADAFGDSDTQSYEVVVSNPALTGNGNLKGTYTCMAQMFTGEGGGQTWPMPFTMLADGQGNITGGIYDGGPIHTTAAPSGTLTGTYNIGTNNTGTMAVVYVSSGTGVGEFTKAWAVALTNAVSPAQQLRMVETDDVGTEPSDQWGTANCYLDDTSAFVSSLLSRSLVFDLPGFLAIGYVQETVGAEAGRFDSSAGTITNFHMDTATAGAALSSISMTGSFGTLDTANGRVQATLTEGATQVNLLFYFIDSERAFVVDNSPSNGADQVFSGEARVQQQSSYTATSANGPFVLSIQGAEISLVKGSYIPSTYYSEALQGTGDGEGNLVFNGGYEDSGGVCSPESSIGTIGMSFDNSNPGRALFLPWSSTSGTALGYLYFFDNNDAFEIGETSNSIETGLLEPQMQSAFTDAALAGDYMVGELPQVEANPPVNPPASPSTPTSTVGELNLNSSGSITGSTTTAGNGVLNTGQSVVMAYNWDSNFPNTGGFVLSGSLGTGESSCIVVSSTEFVCTPQTDPVPYLMRGRQ